MQLDIEARKKGIGGSDIAVIVGLNKYKTSVELWMEKTGRAAPQRENNKMHWGHLLEDVVAREYARQTGLEVLDGVNLVDGIRRGNTDRMVPDARKILEIKTAGHFAAAEWGEPGTDEIPDAYLCQVQWYLGLLNPDEYVSADVPVLIGGQDYRVYHVERNDELIGQLIEAGERWWRDYVVADRAPEADGTVEDARARLSLFPRDNGQILQSTAEIDDIAHRLARARAQLKAAEEVEESLSARLKAVIGDAAGIAGPDWSATWKTSKGASKTDWKAVASELNAPAELIAAHTRQASGSRRFLPKFNFDVSAE